MFSRILVPLDGSDVAARALPYAVTLAEKLHCSLSLVSVLVPHLKDLSVGDLFGITSATRREAEERAASAAVAHLQSVATPLRARGLDVGWDLIRAESAAGGIIESAAMVEHTLIVMGTHGRTGFQRLRLGSVAQRVIRQATAPTLVVHARPHSPHEELVHVQRITVALDGSPFAERALPVACRLAAAFAVPLTLLRVLPDAIHASGYYAAAYIPPIKELERYAHEDAERYLTQVSERLKPMDVQIRWLLNMAGPPADAMIEYLRQQPPGITVMASHGRGGIMRLAYASTAEEIVTGASGPVLIVRTITAPPAETTTAEEFDMRAADSPSRSGQQMPARR